VFSTIFLKKKHDIQIFFKCINLLLYGFYCTVFL